MSIPTTFIEGASANGTHRIAVKGELSLLLWGEFDGATVSIGFEAPDESEIIPLDPVFSEITASRAVLVQTGAQTRTLVVQVENAGLGTNLNASI